jgi:hypothetical protein
MIKVRFHKIFKFWKKYDVFIFSKKWSETPLSLETKIENILSKFYNVPVNNFIRM